MTKQSEHIRAQIRQRRRKLSANEQRFLAKRATDRLLQSSRFQKSCYIACYIAIDNEIATKALIGAIWQQQKQCYLPVIDRCHPGNMHFHLYQANDNLIKNKWQIPEPSASSPRITADALDLVMMPLVAFDQAGHRLGTGGGYYDRYFANIKQWPKAPYLCGFAYHCQQVAELPTQDWDVAMHAIVTDQQFITVDDDPEN